MNGLSDAHYVPCSNIAAVHTFTLHTLMMQCSKAIVVSMSSMQLSGASHSAHGGLHVV